MWKILHGKEMFTVIHEVFVVYVVVLRINYESSYTGPSTNCNSTGWEDFCEEKKKHSDLSSSKDKLIKT